MTDEATRSARMEWADFGSVAADANAALLALSKAAGVSGLDPALLELVKLRCSQINGCAFCVQWHATAARKLGVSEDRLQLLVTWREVPGEVYSPRERAALGWAEALTDVGGGVPDRVYADALQAFDPRELAYLSSAVVAVNAWNRLGVAYRFTPPGLVSVAEPGRVSSMGDS